MMLNMFLTHNIGVGSRLAWGERLLALGSRLAWGERERVLALGSRLAWGERLLAIDICMLTLVPR